MDDTVTDGVEQAYLDRLAHAAAVLPADQSAELLENITEHIARARGSGEAPDEASLRSLLDRLGTPEEIVAAAREDAPAATASSYSPPPYPYPVPPPRRPGIGLEIAAVVLMTVGSIVPLVGWLVGAALLWSSRRWRVREKLLATLIVPGGPFFVLIFGGLAAAGRTCTSSSSGQAGSDPTFLIPSHCTGFAFPPAVGITLLLFCMVAPFVIGGVLLLRARARADLELIGG